MKTKHFIPALSLLLLMIGMTTIFAKPISSPNPLVQLKQDVTYVVNIAHGDHLSGFNCTYFVIVTDERGRLVAPAQLFRMGVWTYQVKERGPVTGTRVANLVRNANMICPNAYWFAPDSKTGIFKGGASYLFTLTPVAGSTTSGD